MNYMLLLVIIIAAAIGIGVGLGLWLGRPVSSSDLFRAVARAGCETCGTLRFHARFCKKGCPTCLFDGLDRSHAQTCPSNMRATEPSKSVHLGPNSAALPLR